MAVYLAHFDAPYPRDSRASVLHYAGFSTGSTGMILRRHDHHRRGRGSRLLAAVSARGIGWSVVRIWRDGDRTLERAIKRRRQLSHFCPVCNPKMRRYRLRAEHWRIRPIPRSIDTTTDTEVMTHGDL